MADSTPEYPLLVGPLLIGLIADTIIFGLCFMLAARYLLLDFKDGLYIKSLLVWTFILNAFQIGSETSLVWHYVVANFVNPTALFSFPWQYSAIPLFTALVALPIQTFLARRVMQLSGSVIAAAIMAVLAVAQAVLNMITSVRHLENSTLVEPQTSTKINLVVSVISTVVIAGILGMLILQQQPRKESEDDTWGLGYYSWTFAASSMPSAILAILQLATFFAKPGTNLHVLFALPIARLYTTALLANLNERNPHRTQSGEGSQNKPISLGVLSQNRQQKPKTPVHITISHDVDVQMESGESDKLSDKQVPIDYSPSTPLSGYSYGKAQPMGLGY